MVVPELDEQLHGTQARRDPRVHRDAARTLRRARRRRGDVPRHREGSQAEGAARAHRRVGRRGQRVRHRRASCATTSASGSRRCRSCRRRWPSRDKVLEAAADLVPIAAPEALVDDETRRRIEDLAHRLSHQDATLEEYLEATGQEPQAFIDEVREGRRAGRARRPGAARGRRAGGDRGDRRRGRRRGRAARRASSKRRSKRCAAISNGGARWRRYALILHAGRRSNSSSTTRPWSTRRGT